LLIFIIGGGLYWANEAYWANRANKPN
jgi:hypothetical protein